ncbi:MAG: PilZ domain-containing protein [Myxococcota bacterium]
MEVTSGAKERRRSVRLRPIPDLPAHARLVDDGTDLQVWDVSVGGLAVVAPPAEAHLQPGTRHALMLDLGRFGTFELQAEVRHRSHDADGTIGMQLVEPPREATTAIGRYVAELLQRGALS